MSDTNTKIIKNPSPLVLAVLTLDANFQDLKRLAERIEDSEMKSSFDFEQTEKLINHFAQTGEAISQNIAQFVNVLNETRAEAESAAEKVSARADQLKLRKDDIQGKMARFEALSNKVSELNQSLIQFRRPAGETLNDADREQLKSRLGEIASQLSALIDEAQDLKSIGHNEKIKVLEQNAEAMRQSLISVSQKISAMLPLQ